LITQLKEQTRPGGFHVIRALGEQTPRVSDSTKTSFVPWLERYSNWRVVRFTYRDNDISSRYAESSHWLFDHGTTLIAQKQLPIERRRRLEKAQK
jgi:hypothetical protein